MGRDITKSVYDEGFSGVYGGSMPIFTPSLFRFSQIGRVCVWIFLIQQVRQVAACDWQLADAHMVCDAGIILFVFLVLRLFVITLTFVLH
jgi:hypothetical protein